MIALQIRDDYEAVSTARHRVRCMEWNYWRPLTRLMKCKRRIYSQCNELLQQVNTSDVNSVKSSYSIMIYICFINVV